MTGASPEAPPAASELPRCPCGHDRHHFMVSAELKYSGWGWFLFVLGATARPVRAVFRCRVCGKVIEQTEDRAVLDTLG